jgi:hypothetical protein
VVARRPDLRNPFAKLSGCLDGGALDISLQLSLPVKVVQVKEGYLTFAMSSRSRANPGLTNRARIYFREKDEKRMGAGNP